MSFGSHITSAFCNITMAVAVRSVDGVKTIGERGDGHEK
jgi:hypothetical protein